MGKPENRKGSIVEENTPESLAIREKEVAARERVLDTGDRVVERIGRSLNIALVLAGFAAALAGLFGYTSLRDLRNDVGEEVAEMKLGASNAVHRVEVDGRLALGDALLQVSNRIEFELSKEYLTALITNQAKAAVKETAGDLIRYEVASRVDPLTAFASSNAATSLKRLEEINKEIDVSRLQSREASNQLYSVDQQLSRSFSAANAASNDLSQLKQEFRSLLVDLTAATNQLRELSESYRRETAAMKAHADLMWTILKALSDDARAFEHLGTLVDAGDTNSTYARAAYLMVIDHYNLFEIATDRGMTLQPLPFDAEAFKRMQLPEILTRFRDTQDPQLRRKMVPLIWERADIPKEMRLKTLVALHLTDPSLYVRSCIGSFLNTEPGANYRSLASREFGRWWLTHGTNYLTVATNQQVVSIRTNVPSNTSQNSNVAR